MRIIHRLNRINPHETSASVGTVETSGCRLSIQTHSLEAQRDATTLRPQLTHNPATRQKKNFESSSDAAIRQFILSSRRLIHFSHNVSPCDCFFFFLKTWVSPRGNSPLYYCSPGRSIERLMEINGGRERDEKEGGKQRGARDQDSWGGG